MSTFAKKVMQRSIISEYVLCDRVTVYRGSPHSPVTSLVIIIMIINNNKFFV